MTQLSSIIKFIRQDKEKILLELASVDNELKAHFKTYLHNEYKGDQAKQLDYVDIAEIAHFIVDKLKFRQTELFIAFFEKVETILSNCDSYVENLIVVGLFESLQNNCGTNLDYHYIFNPWLGQLSKARWDTLIDNWEGDEWRTKYIGKV